jgi:hypothetical protein
MTDVELTGEAREKLHRQRYWKVLGGIALFAAPLGAVVGFKAGSAAGQGADLASAVAGLPPAYSVAMAALLALSITVGTWKFVKTIDEVELADNLWASAAGFYFYAIAYPCWWLLWIGRVLPEPSNWILYILTLVAGFAVYVGRKVGR